MSVGDLLGVLTFEGKRSKMVNFMSMAMGSRATVFLLHTLLWLLLSIDTCNGVESDIQCLKALKASLNDSNGYLASWDFNNNTEGFICKFNGIDCWHPDESKVLNIRLSNMDLKGQFPLALKNCTSMTGLDLSTNELSGTLPDNMGSIIPYVTTLDLSYNNFTGEIPESLGNCTYLNTLSLQHNQLTGQIPSQLGQLDRLSQFSVVENSLSGPIPSFVKKTIQASSFVNNAGLCGWPLEACKEPSPKKSHHKVLIGLVIGGIVFAVILVSVICFRRLSNKKNKEEELRGNQWVQSVKASKDIELDHTTRRFCNVHVSTFEKTVQKMRLNNLLKATNNFSKDSIIGSGRAGIMYKATLPDGSFLAIKRFRDSRNSDKEFISAMTVLSPLKHCNVAPLLGFCIARKERLLVYKYMENGTLYQQLHGVKPVPGSMEWPLRLRIAIGLARGLAWLHHSCNPYIVHHNISSKRILLDWDYEPKISKFRFARLMNPIENHPSAAINFNNLAYIAPEYKIKVVGSRAADVYSFGVVLLEIITGQKPTKVANAPKGFNGNLVEWITYIKSNSLLSYAFDRSLIGKGCDDELLQFLRVAVACVMFDPEERPTMHVAYQLLLSIGKRYNFTDRDEMQRAQVSIDMDGPDEVNVGRQTQEIHQTFQKMRKAASF